VSFAPQELAFIGIALGWVACAFCFWLIPSWRARDVKRLKDAELSVLCDEVLREMQIRSYTGEQVRALSNCRVVIVGTFPPPERRQAPRVLDD
jgi:hypothetical protein